MYLPSRWPAMSIYHALLESSSLTSYPLPLLTPISLTGESKLPWSSTCALNPESTPQSPPFRSPEMLEPPRNPSASRPCHLDFGSDSVWIISDSDNSDERVIISSDYMTIRFGFGLDCVGFRSVSDQFLRIF
ncbi:unnamed protein product [Arabidopsis thaliana]|uniref:Uncharacterized protein n=1 Tax=Arabidopsis thaliana TaxID=3702 RepID=Q9MBH4_ARATH|nr:unnamed protein product [Arabidopsis thaliana]